MADESLQLPQLDALRSWFESQSETVLESADALLETSLVHGPGRTIGAILVFDSLTFRWRFYLSKQDDQLRWFFRRRKHVFAIVIDLAVMMRIARGLPPARMATRARIAYWFSSPPFLAREPGVEHPSGSAMLLALGDDGRDTLMVRNALHAVETGDFGQLVMRYVSSAGASDVEPRDDGRWWPASAFFALARTLSRWLRGDLGHGQLAPIAIDESEDVGCIISRLTDAYRGAGDALSRGQDAPGTSAARIVDALRPGYRIDAFEATLTLRLTEDLRLAFESESAFFHLGVHLRYVGDGQGTRATLDARPPDYLVTGELYDAMLESLGTLGAKELEKLGVDEAEMASIIASNRRDHGSILRIRREATRVDGEYESIDTDLFILHRPDGGKGAYLVFRGAFDLDTDAYGEAPPRARYRGGLARLYNARSNMLHKDAVMYFLRLLATIERWRGKLHV